MTVHVPAFRALREIGRAGGPYLLWSGSLLLAAMLACGALDVIFGYGPFAPLLHGAYVLAWLGIQTLCLGIAVRLLAPLCPSLAGLLVWVALGATTACLVFLYGANLITNLLWGGLADRGFVLRIPAHLAELAAAERLPLWLLYAGLGIVIVIVVAPLALAARPCSTSLQRLFSATHSGSLLRTRPRAYATLAWTLGVPALLAVLSVPLFAPGADLRWRGELLSTLVLENAYERYRDQPILLEERRLDSIVRRNYAVPSPMHRPNVILIIADSMRAANTGVYGYPRPTTPFLSELHAQGNLERIDFATSTCSESLCGILSILTSRPFNRITYRLYKLPELLSSAGYRVHYVMSGNHRWLEFPKLLGQEYDSFTDGFANESYTMSDDRGVLRRLAAHAPYDGTSTFFVIHLMSSHRMGAALERTDLWSDGQRSAEWQSLRSSESAYPSRVQVYDQRILQADSVIEQVFGILKDHGYLEDALVVVTSDHGEAQGEHGYVGHVFQLHQEDIQIPFLIYDTAGHRYADTEYATHVDIAATIVDRLSLPIPATWHGRSVLRPPAPAARYTFHQTNVEPYQYAVIRHSDQAIYKLLDNEPHAGPIERSLMFAMLEGSGSNLHGIVEPDAARRFLLEGERLYDLIQDPHETRNLVGSADPALLQDLRTRLERYRSGREGPEPERAGALGGP